jgi:hypothetical protein
MARQLIGIGDVETDQIAAVVTIAEGDDVGVEADLDLAGALYAVQCGLLR